MTNKISKQATSDAEKILDKIAHEEIKRHITAQGLRNKSGKGSHQTMWYWDLMKAIRNEPTSAEDYSQPVGVRFLRSNHRPRDVGHPANPVTVS